MAINVFKDTANGYTPVSYGFRIYPNPARDELTIAWQNLVIATAVMILFDIAGKEDGTLARKIIVIIKI